MFKTSLMIFLFAGIATNSYGNSSSSLTTYHCIDSKNEGLVFTLSNPKNEILNKVKEVCVSASRYYEKSEPFVWKNCDLRIEKKEATSIVFTSNVCSYYLNTKNDLVTESCDFSVEGVEPPPNPIFKCKEIK